MTRPRLNTEARSRPQLRPRVQPREAEPDGGLYFSSPKTDLQFIPTGSKMLDLALGGGWVEGRIINIVGDKSTGKTLLVIEAAANFSIKYPQGKEDIGYREAEHAFQPMYAKALGFPLGRLDNWNSRTGKLTKQVRTVEDLFDDLVDVIERQKKRKKKPFLYVIDSLDAISDEEEMERDFRKNTMGQAKPKALSELFRRLNAELEDNNVTVIIISQVRSKIGMHFGRDVQRSGGRALDFYASQALYLADIGKLKQTVRSIDTVIGVKIVAKVDKNKVSNSYRSVEFPIRFGFGVNDVRSCLAFLKKINALKDFFNKSAKTDGELDAYVDKIDRMTKEERKEEIKELHDLVEKLWWQMEKSVQPIRSKYE